VVPFKIETPGVGHRFSRAKVETVKVLFCTLALVACFGAAWCQTPDSPEQVIRRMIRMGNLESHDSKVLGPMGDAAAVIVTKVAAGRKLSVTEMDSVLTVLYQSFADPSMVPVVSDRQPLTTLFVLQSMASATKDTALKGRIAEARSYIEKRYAEYAKSALPPPKQ
jgi:hypothetical protein